MAWTGASSPPLTPPCWDPSLGDFVRDDPVRGRSAHDRRPAVPVPGWEESMRQVDEFRSVCFNEGHPYPDEDKTPRQSGWRNPALEVRMVLVAVVLAVPGII